MEIIVKNINQSLIELSKKLIEFGVERETRGFKCFELPEPVMIKITNPCDRFITIPERKWNKVLPFAETAWILLGINSLEFPGSYVKNLYNFSDDGEFMRAGYGTRIRAYTGNNSDYKINNPFNRNIFSGSTSVTDQLRYVIESFKRDANSRQMIIEIGDPAKDSFDENGNLKTTKDYPCTRLLNFQLRSGKLDLTVYIRSNDHIWGAHAVNITNFTLIQEIVSRIIGVEIGNYYHIANNYHYYEDKRDLVEKISNLNSYDYQGSYFEYPKTEMSLEKFDDMLYWLYSYENYLRTSGADEIHESHFIDPFFNDWARVFYNYHTKQKTEFINPILNKLFNE